MVWLPDIRKKASWIVALTSGIVAVVATNILIPSTFLPSFLYESSSIPSTHASNSTSKVSSFPGKDQDASIYSTKTTFQIELVPNDEILYRMKLHNLTRSERHQSKFYKQKKILQSSNFPKSLFYDANTLNSSAVILNSQYAYRYVSSNGFFRQLLCYDGIFT
jgi:hypothetical protein